MSLQEWQSNTNIYDVAWNGQGVKYIVNNGSLLGKGSTNDPTTKLLSKIGARILGTSQTHTN